MTAYTVTLSGGRMAVVAQDAASAGSVAQFAVWRSTGRWCDVVSVEQL